MAKSNNKAINAKIEAYMASIPEAQVPLEGTKETCGRMMAKLIMNIIKYNIEGRNDPYVKSPIRTVGGNPYLKTPVTTVNEERQIVADQLLGAITKGDFKKLSSLYSRKWRHKTITMLGMEFDVKKECENLIIRDSYVESIFMEDSFDLCLDNPYNLEDRIAWIKTYLENTVESNVGYKPDVKIKRVKYSYYDNVSFSFFRYDGSIRFGDESFTMTEETIQNIPEKAIKDVIDKIGQSLAELAGIPTRLLTLPKIAERNKKIHASIDEMLNKENHGGLKLVDISYDFDNFEKDDPIFWFRAMFSGSKRQGIAKEFIVTSCGDFMRFNEDLDKIAAQNRYESKIPDLNYDEYPIDAVYAHMLIKHYGDEADDIVKKIISSEETKVFNGAPFRHNGRFKAGVISGQFDLHNGMRWAYGTLVAPEMPESVLNALKGKRFIDIIDMDVPGMSNVTIESATNNKKGANIKTATPETNLKDLRALRASSCETYKKAA